MNYKYLANGKVLQINNIEFFSDHDISIDNNSIDNIYYESIFNDIKTIEISPDIYTYKICRELNENMLESSTRFSFRANNKEFKTLSSIADEKVEKNKIYKTLQEIISTLMKKSNIYFYIKIKIENLEKNKNYTRPIFTIGQNKFLDSRYSYKFLIKKETNKDEIHLRFSISTGETVNDVYNYDFILNSNKIPDLTDDLETFIILTKGKKYNQEFHNKDFLMYLKIFVRDSKNNTDEFKITINDKISFDSFDFDRTLILKSYTGLENRNEDYIVKDFRMGSCEDADNFHKNNLSQKEIDNLLFEKYMVNVYERDRRNKIASEIIKIRANQDKNNWFRDFRIHLSSFKREIDLNNEFIKYVTKFKENKDIGLDKIHYGIEKDKKRWNGYLKDNFTIYITSWHDLLPDEDRHSYNTYYSTSWFTPSDLDSVLNLIKQFLIEITKKVDCEYNYSKCGKDCKKKINIIKYSKNRGKECPEKEIVCEQGEDDCPLEPIKCRGSWSKCYIDPLDNICKKKYSVYQEAQHGGRKCPYNHEEIKNCNSKEEGCTKDCVGFWSDCKNCKKKYTITQYEDGNGTKCEAGNGEEKNCKPGEDNCPEDQDCVAEWSDCDINCKKKWNVKKKQIGNGNCDYEDGYEEKCSKDECSLDKDCVYEWSPCNKNCKKKWIVYEESLGEGKCKYKDGDELDCDEGNDRCFINKNCKGTWTVCNKDCIKTWEITESETGNEGKCSKPEETELKCNPGEGLCPVLTLNEEFRNDSREKNSENILVILIFVLIILIIFLLCR